MEGLIILAAIYVLEVVVKKVVASKKNQPQEHHPLPDDEPEQESEQASPPKSLRDLIRQFEEAQRDASGGTYVPPTPEVEEDNELPVVQPANPGKFTFSEIAESVVQWEYVNIQMLQEGFGFSENVARVILKKLQENHIVGQDMGEGYCDLLVHDKGELNNLLMRSQQEAERQKAAAQERAARERREAEIKRQNELAELEERARQLREIANSGITPENSALAASGTSNMKRTRTFNKAEIRRGFIWGKVLDEPRFKKRWNARVR